MEREASLWGNRELGLRGAQEDAEGLLLPAGVPGDSQLEVLSGGSDESARGTTQGAAQPGRETGPHPSRGQKEPTESSPEPPACKKLLFFPNYEHFFNRGVGQRAEEDFIRTLRGCHCV